MELILEHVRSFDNRIVIPIRPLTLLTGENSAGKTTLLAALSAACDPVGFPLRPRFNEPPYDMGSYETIATNKGGRYGRAKSVSIGFKKTPGRQGQPSPEMCASYTNSNGQPALTNVRLQSREALLSLDFDDPEQRAGRLEFNSGAMELSIPFHVERSSRRLSLIDYLFAHLYPRLESNLSDIRRLSKVSDELLRLVSDTSPPTAISIAPIRTKPQRTYDRMQDDFSPEGSHIPYLLLRHLVGPIGSENALLRSALQKFGRASGLFEKLDVKRLGDKASDPFQLFVTGSGKPANLLDVGYGVSQGLPIVVQSLLAPPATLLLLQQPEVHLHPRAQAALGTFFVELARGRKSEIVIETHSDYVVDRIRQEVASGSIKCDDVLVLYLEKSGHETSVHTLTLDPSGNILNAPPGYRDFFLREELNLIRRTELG